MPVTVIAPTDIYFQDTSTPDITSWLWLFGDGDTATTQNPTHTYSTPGVYVVTLEATGPLGVLTFQDVVTVIGANYWPLNEVSGARRDWYAGLNLTQNNGVSSVVDATGRSALFDAASSQYLSRTANGTELYPQGDYTISCWIYPTGTTFFNVYTVLSKVDLNVINRAYNLTWHYFSNGYNQFLNVGWFGSDGSSTSGYSPSFVAPVNEWTHVAFGYDAAIKTGRFWINGVDMAQYFDGVLTADPVTTGAAELRIGAGNLSGVNAANFFDGRIRAVRMFDSLLSTEEVQAVMAETWDDTLNIWTQPDLAYVQWPPGSEPQVMLRMSNDGGKNWGPELWRPVGKVGQYAKRVRWNRLGSGRQRVFEVSVTDPIEWKITAAYLKANQSES